MTSFLPMPPSVRAIILAVAQETGVPVATMLGERRTQLVYRARREAMGRVRETIKIGGRAPSYPLMGRWFGKDHTTVLYSCKDRLRELSTGNALPVEWRDPPLQAAANSGKLLACI